MLNQNSSGIIFKNTFITGGWDEKETGRIIDATDSTGTILRGGRRTKTRPLSASCTSPLMHFPPAKLSQIGPKLSVPLLNGGNRPPPPEGSSMASSLL